MRYLQTAKARLAPYIDGTAPGMVAASQTAAPTWQRWTVAAPVGKTIRSLAVAKSSEGHSLVIDDLEWRWAPGSLRGGGDSRPEQPTLKETSGFQPVSASGMIDIVGPNS